MEITFAWNGSETNAHRSRDEDGHALGSYLNDRKKPKGDDMTIKKRTSSTRVTIATLIALLSFSAGKIWAVSSWTTRVDMRLSRIEQFLRIPTVPEQLGPDVFRNAEAKEKH